ncbi:hypothetical protein PTTG_03744 [Puccinia triticina 1-1 BBBD Race 1]|uniref:Uncharacterized protein n=1 Tax=Puccinia triticina (isolate 1-1 / race 1 (BBBD)) TaxID=630390 RepID=A0A0C4ESG9_PUCT1|nr:hypothetical protein PTTG_03744 [Puccinia triticina 1-1 BBBD Race 1]
MGDNQGPAENDTQEVGNEEIEREDVPRSLFEEEDLDDEEGELSWMDMIGVAIGQIDAEPQETGPDASNPLCCREEAEIKKVKPDNSAWYPVPNQEVRSYIFIVE